MSLPHAADPLDNPVLQLILRGRAATIDEAEEIYLDESLPDVLALVGGPLDNAELECHPLMVLLRWRGMRGREDSPA